MHSPTQSAVVYSYLCDLCIYTVYKFTAQASYLQWLEHTGVNAGVVAPCDDCSSEEIMLPVSVPFGNYNHSSLYVSENDNCVYIAYSSTVSNSIGLYFTIIAVPETFS